MTKAQIFYHDIGDYLTREQKLALVKNFRSISNMEFIELIPNEHGDWLNQRNDIFGSFIPLEPEKKFDVKAKSFFVVYSRGLETTRDAWVYNFSKEILSKNMKLTIDFYNKQVDEFIGNSTKNLKIRVENFIDTNPLKISWSSSLIPNVQKGNKTNFHEGKFINSLYRPFCKINLYWNNLFIHRKGQFPEIFPTTQHKNLLICVPGIGDTKDFSVIITNTIPDLGIEGASQCFPLYYYEENKTLDNNIFGEIDKEKYIRRDAVSNFILERAKQQYGVSASLNHRITKEDIFYYVYGILHNQEYRKAFTADLKKMLPRLPLVDDVRDFWAFSKAGRALAELHLSYETTGKYPGVIEMYNPLNTTDTLKQANKEELEYLNYRVEKMRFSSKTDKSKIIYNSQITIENIPAKAYKYVVNGKSAIEWVMERYQITTHKESGITNNPNDWAKETGNSRYILDLLLSIINVSVKTVDIVEGLPKVEWG